MEDKIIVRSKKDDGHIRIVKVESLPKGFYPVSCPYTGGYCKFTCAAFGYNEDLKRAHCFASGKALELGELDISSEHI